MANNAHENIHKHILIHIKRYFVYTEGFTKKTQIMLIKRCIHQRKKSTKSQPAINKRVWERKGK